MSAPRCWNCDAVQDPAREASTADLMVKLKAALIAEKHDARGADNCVLCHLLKALTDPIPCNHSVAALASREPTPASEVSDG